METRSLALQKQLSRYACISLGAEVVNIFLSLCFDHWNCSLVHLCIEESSYEFIQTQDHLCLDLNFVSPNLYFIAQVYDKLLQVPFFFFLYQ